MMAPGGQGSGTIKPMFPEGDRHMSGVVFSQFSPAVGWALAAVVAADGAADSLIACRLEKRLRQVVA